MMRSQREWRVRYNHAILGTRGGRPRCGAGKRDRMSSVIRSSLLDILPANVRAAMQRECEILTFEDGQPIVRAGETGDSYFLITRGAADVVTPQGMTIATLEPGQGFGELALL